jgi:hypothetical protein
MLNILDFYCDDDHKILEKIASKIPVELSKLKVMPHNFIPQKSYAYIEKDAYTGEDVRRFPINNKASVVLSYLYLGENRDEMSKEAFDNTLSKIKVAAKALDVDLDSLPTIESKEDVPQVEKIASTPINWKSFIVGNLAGGTKEIVLDCIEKFSSWNTKLTPREAFEVASDIIKVSESLEVPIPKESLLYKYRMVDPGTLNKDAAVIVQIRYDYYPEELCKVAKELLDDMHSMPAIAVANTLYEMDKLAGVTDRYVHDVPNPYIHMFAGKSWSFVNRNRDKKLVKEASVKLSQFFNQDIIKKAEADVVSAYRELGTYGKAIFRKILSGIDFDKKE